MQPAAQQHMEMSDNTVNPCRRYINAWDTETNTNHIFSINSVSFNLFCEHLLQSQFCNKVIFLFQLTKYFFLS